jgi:hypothetical protein
MATTKKRSRRKIDRVDIRLEKSGEMTWANPTGTRETKLRYLAGDLMRDYEMVPSSSGVPGMFDVFDRARNSCTLDFGSFTLVGPKGEYDSYEFTQAVRLLMKSANGSIILDSDKVRDKHGEFFLIIEAVERGYDDDEEGRENYPNGIEYMVSNGWPGQRSEGHSYQSYVLAKEFYNDVKKRGYKKALGVK